MIWVRDGAKGIHRLAVSLCTVNTSSKGSHPISEAVINADTKNSLILRFRTDDACAFHKCSASGIPVSVIHTGSTSVIHAGSTSVSDCTICSDEYCTHHGSCSAENGIAKCNCHWLFDDGATCKGVQVCAR